MNTLTISLTRQEYALTQKALSLYEESLSLGQRTDEKNAKLEDIWRLLDRLFDAYSAQNAE